MKKKIEIQDRLDLIRLKQVNICAMLEGNPHMHYDIGNTYRDALRELNIEVNALEWVLSKK